MSRTRFSFTRKIRRVCVVASAFALAACSDDMATRPLDDDLASRVRALGFDANGLEDHGSYIVVEGDIRIEKNALFRGPGAAMDRGDPSIEAPQTPLWQWRTTAIVSTSAVGQIKVNLSNINSTSNWAQAARDMMAAYNATGSGIHMVEGTPAAITFSSVSSAGYYASASWPSNGQPGPTITVNTQHNGLALNKKQWLLAHEFGHTLGLRHDNAHALEGQLTMGAHLISGTPVIDPGSIMIKNYNNHVWTSFSNDDKLALSTLYPGPALLMSIVNPNPLAAMMNCTFTALPVGGTAPYTISWSIIGDGPFSPSYGSGLNFTTRLYWGDASSTNYTVSATVNDAAGQVYGTSEYHQASGYGGWYDSQRCTF